MSVFQAWPFSRDHTRSLRILFGRTTKTVVSLICGARSMVNPLYFIRYLIDSQCYAINFIDVVQDVFYFWVFRYSVGIETNPEVGQPLLSLRHNVEADYCIGLNSPSSSSSAVAI